MNILGYSGLHQSVAFKSEQFPELSPREYRIAQGFDSAAALVNPQGIIAAAAEERFTGKKGTNTFPVNAVNYCLSAANLRANQIDFIAHSFNYEPFKAEFQRNLYAQQQFDCVYAKQIQINNLQDFMPDNYLADKLVQVPHHLAHAASTYYVSGFNESLILVVDGMGELHSTTIAIGQGRDIEILETITAPHSLGILYGVFTLYLGFWMSFDEYKIMGLAPYGDPRRYFKQVMEFVHLKSNGVYTIPLLFRNKTTLEQETYAGTLQVLEETFGPRRRPDEDISQHHMDIAAALQTVLQAGLMHILRHFQRETGQRNLCMAGGVALNCTANGVIKRSRLFNGFFIQPAAADDGTALGAALYVQQQQQPAPSLKKMSMPFWGPEFTAEQIESELRARSTCEFVYHPQFDNLAEAVVQQLLNGQVVAWFQGEMEFGPRALGNRSILADPRGPHTREHINRLVKKREDFRPFAPAVPTEAAAQYFDIDDGDDALYAHMLCVTQVKPEYRGQMPAITHVDGSARVQVVSQTGNSRFWRLLNKFGAAGGLPVLLNTSFNLRGQPIVRSPAIAIDTFLNSEIDILVVGDYLVTRTNTENTL